MRSSAFIAIAFLAFTAACKPHHDENPNGEIPEETEGSIPEARSVTSAFAGIATREDYSQFANAFVAHASGVNSSLIGANFFIKPVPTDKYLTRFSLNDPQGVEVNKVIAVTDSALNYVRVKAMPSSYVADVFNSADGTAFFGSGGSVEFPANSMYITARPTRPGFYGINIKSPISLSYTTPLSEDFGVNIPSYSMGDLDGKRWYLNSLGVVRISAGYYYAADDQNENDVYPGYHLKLKMPVPAGLSTLLPDSVPLWRLTNFQWTKTAMAYRTGETYTAIINQVGAYNLAIPVKGVYKTVHVQTTSGSPLVNTSVKIRKGAAVLYESQTDWNGNAIVFAPANEILTAEIFEDWEIWYNPGVLKTAEINTAAGNTPIEISVPTVKGTIYSFKGTATNCDGTPIAAGRVEVLSGTIGRVWYIPIENGRFNSSVIGEFGSNIHFRLNATNTATSVTGKDTTVVPDAMAENEYNLRTCAESPELFIRFRIDNDAEQSITGSTANLHNPPLFAYMAQNKTMISGGTQATSLQFETYATASGSFPFSGIGALFIHNQYAEWDFNKPMNVTFTRYDINLGGIVEGSAEFWYTDSIGVSHRLQCTFRVYRYI